MAASHFHAVVFPFPEHGHINPMLQLAHHLAASRGAMITFVNTHRSHGNVSKCFNDDDDIGRLVRFVSISDGLPAEQTLSVHTLVTGDGPNSMTGTGALLGSLEKQGPSLERLLRAIDATSSPRVSCFISDAFLPWTEQVARSLGVPWVVFSTSSATRMCISIPILKQLQAHSDPAFKNCNVELNISNLPFNKEHVDAYTVSTSAVKFTTKRIKALEGADCLLMNTFEDIEKEAFSLIHLTVPVLLIGPLCCCVTANPWQESRLNDGDLLSWLDMQEINSVLYICLGTKVHVQGKQLEQLALGIEASGKPFVWVLQVSKESSGVLHEFVEDFVKRTKGKGMVVSWVNQTTVLEHRAVGAFLTHCGWNSVLEALVSGVPMICLPVFADQYNNRLLVERQWRIGRGLAKEMQADEIAAVCDEVMSDQDLRCRAALLSRSSRRAVQPGGTSHQHMETFVQFVQHGIAHSENKTCSPLFP